jgi:hypothetical protein
MLGQFLQRRHVLVIEAEAALDHPAMLVGQFGEPVLHVVFHLGGLQHVFRPLGMFVGDGLANR